MYILAGILGMILMWSINRLIIRNTVPFYWLCPTENCWFLVRSNNKDLLNQGCTDHVAQHFSKAKGL